MTFPTVRTEGAILPSDILRRIAEGDRGLVGLRPEDYHLAAGERLNEAINRSWNRLLGAWTAFRAQLDRPQESEAATRLTRERWLLPLFQELGYGRLPAARAIELNSGRTYPVSHLWGTTPIHLVGAGVDLDSRTARVAGAARSSPHSMVQELLNRSPHHLWAFLANGLRLRILRDNTSLTRQAYVEFDLEAMMTGEVYADFALLWLVCHQSRFETEGGAEGVGNGEWGGAAPASSAPPSSPLPTPLIEQWRLAADRGGVRALDELRRGVEAAITALGSGFLAHRANRTLRERLRGGELSTQDYYRQVLRMVYRLLFLFVAEDRELLLDPAADGAARERYARHYSTARLRRLAERRPGSRHADGYHSLRVIMERLNSDDGYPALALPALGGFLFSPEAAPDLAGCEIANSHLLMAVHALALTTDGSIRRSVDYRNLNVEEMGSVYESLLELHPEIDAEAGHFELRVAAGSERKTTGSYYTPDSLVRCLLDSALDPVLAEAAARPDPEAAILALKVCDPACGSGHFLIAAARRIAHRLAAVRTGEEEPAPEAVRHALRAVIGNCIYGVDVNPMAVELCKVSLWMEALDPGRPLSFLDHRIQVGNSLLGTTPALLAAGIPDAAFEPIEGDDKAVAREWRKANRQQREGRYQLGFGDTVPDAWDRLGNLAPALAHALAAGDDTAAGQRRREEAYARLVGSGDYEHNRLLADAWCAAFVWKKTRQRGTATGEVEGFAYPVDEKRFRDIERNPYSVPERMRAEIRRLAKQYGFFHWHLAFPDVFRLPAKGAEPENVQTGWDGGFDVLLGNPPWERIKLQEKEWFAARRPEIASAANAAARRRMIDALQQGDEGDRALHAAFLEDRRQAEGESHLVRDSGRYPLTGRGDVNTYAVFAETFRTLLSSTGRAGCIVPSGIATDDTTKLFFGDLMQTRSLVSLYDFDSGGGIFREIGHGRFKFSLVTVSGISPTTRSESDFAFFMYQPEDLSAPGRRFTLSATDLERINPNTRTAPIFRSARDAELTRAIYARVPVLIKEGDPEENPWGIRFLAMLHMSNDSGLFRDAAELRKDGWQPVGNRWRKGDAWMTLLYEAKMLHHFTHRYGDYAMRRDGSLDSELPRISADRLGNPDYAVTPRYWVPEHEVAGRLAGRWERGWLLGWRDICRSTDERTVIASVLPRVGVGHKFPLFMFESAIPANVACFYGNLTSFVLDYIARQKIGGTSLTYFYLKQFPILPPDAYTVPCLWASAQPWNGESATSNRGHPSHSPLATPHPLPISVADWLLPRVLELTYTAHDLAPFARDLGYGGPPFRWDDARRFLLRCELDAAFFHLYGVGRDDAAYIMDTFPIVRRKDEKEHGTYRTKDTILAMYDAMAAAMAGGEPYRTRLEPPPGDARVAHLVSAPSH